MAEKIVLQKALAQAGVASRRGAEELIKKGAVEVNGKKITAQGMRVDSEHDEIRVRGKRVTFSTVYEYVLLNKPKGYLTTVHDDRGRKTVMDLAPSKNRLVPVGRLDIDSTGLLILTNDGELVNQITHPKFEHEKEYEVAVEAPSRWGKSAVEKAIKKLEQGVIIADHKKTSPAKAKVVSKKQKNTYVVSVCIHEGRKHQVRQMINAVGLSVESLKRVRIGGLTLGNLPEGHYRALTSDEIKKLSL